MASVTKEQFAKGAIWKMLESLATVGIGAVVSLILTRLLAPEDYGVIALVSVFIVLSEILIQSGLATALVRVKNVDDLDYSTALITSTAISILLYCVMFVCAPLIAHFYSSDILKPVLRVQALSVLLCPIASIRAAKLIRNLDFKPLFFIKAFSGVISGTLGIVMALMGFGVWALVAQRLLELLCTNVIIVIYKKWRFVFVFSMERLKQLFSFSMWTLLVGLLTFSGNYVFTAIIGKTYSMTDLGYYNKGNHSPEMLARYSIGSIVNVFLPTASSRQDDKQRLKSATRKTIAVSSYVLFPMMIGLAIVGEKFVALLFTEKWLPCVPILYCACLYYAFDPLRSLNIQLTYSLGNSRSVVYIETLRLGILASALVLCVLVFNAGIYILSLSVAVANLLALLISQMFVKRQIAYTFREWVSDLTPAILLSACMAGAVYGIGLLSLSLILLLALQLILGASVYITLSVLFRVESFRDICDVLRGIIASKRRVA